MSDNQIDNMLTEIDIAAQDMLMQSSCLPSYEGAKHELRLIVRKHLARLPLPTVPTDATCGGCRWFGLCPNGQKYCVVVKSSWPERHWINGRYSTRIAALADLSRACVDYSRAKETA